MFEYAPIPWEAPKASYSLKGEGRDGGEISRLAPFEAGLRPPLTPPCPGGGTDAAADTRGAIRLMAPPNDETAIAFRFG